jgi:D-glycero-alpha-D-manno-heptose-7-phosphate kinase
MIISQTPLRVSICGGGTDLKGYYSNYGGAVLSTAIDKYVYVIVKERFDEKIYVDYARKEIVDDISEIKHELVREAAIKAGMTTGFEVTMLADIPSEGSGLGSSSSLTVGLLNAFYHYQGIQPVAEQLAREACEIEIDILKKPIGKQDQYIAAYGGISFIRFNQDDSVIVERINIQNGIKRKLGANLLLFFTNITRQADSILFEQKEKINDKLEYHNLIKDLAFQARDAVVQRDIDKIGDLLAENWKLKKELSPNITNTVIDEMYKKANNGGASGAKISGAGGGGFLLVYCTRDKQDQLRETMNEYREMPFLLEPFGSKIIFNYRRYTWK